MVIARSTNSGSDVDQRGAGVPRSAVMGDNDWGWLLLQPCAGQFGDGAEVLASLDALRPDVVFLDIQMPGLIGTEVLQRLRHKPFVVFNRSGSRVKFSARGSPRLFNRGVDLSLGMREAAEPLGGNGGGHPGASGAAVDKEKQDAFLDRLDEALTRLGQGGAA